MTGSERRAITESSRNEMPIAERSIIDSNGAGHSHGRAARRL
jgi:hypothetical protein